MRGVTIRIRRRRSGARLRIGFTLASSLAGRVTETFYANFTRSLRTFEPSSGNDAIVKDGSDDRAGDASTSRLPADRAFVLQLRRQTEPGADLFVGRIEHIASGASEQFVSATDLIRFVRRVLGNE